MKGLRMHLHDNVALCKSMARLWEIYMVCATNALALVVLSACGASGIALFGNYPDLLEMAR